MAEHLERLRVQDGNRVYPQFRHIDPLAVRGSDHARWTHSAQPGDQGAGDESLFRADLLRSQVNPLNHVVVPIGDEKRLAIEGEEVWRAAADRLAVVRRSADQQPRLPAVDDFRLLRGSDIDRPNRKRFRHIGFAQARNSPTLEFHAVPRLGAGIAEGRDSETARVELRIVRLWHGAVFEQADVGHVQPVRLNGQGVRITSDLNRTGYFPLLRVYHDDSEVGDIGAEQIPSVLADLQVHREAVFVFPSRYCHVKRDFHHQLALSRVEQIHLALLATAPIEPTAVGGEVCAAGIETVLLGAFGGRLYLLGGRICTAPILEDPARPSAGNEQQLPIPAHRQPMRPMCHGKGLPGWFQEAPIGKDGHSGRVVFRVTINRRGMQIVCGLRPGGCGWAHKDRQDQQVTGRTDRAVHCGY